MYKNETKEPEKFKTAAAWKRPSISKVYRKLISVLESLHNPVAPASCSESVQGISIDTTKNKQRMKNMTVNHCFEWSNLDLASLAFMPVNPADLITAVYIVIVYIYIYIC